MTEIQYKWREPNVALISASPLNKRSSLTLLSYHGRIIIHSVKLLLHAKPRKTIICSSAASSIVLAPGYHCYTVMTWRGRLHHCPDFHLWICTLWAIGYEGGIMWPGDECWSVAGLSFSNGVAFLTGASQNAVAFLFFIQRLSAFISNPDIHELHWWISGCLYSS